MAAEFSSFLSPDVRSLVINIGERYLKSEKASTVHGFITSNSTLDWQRIGSVFGDIPDGFKLHTQTSDWFHETANKLWPVFAEAHHLVMHADIKLINHLYDLCAWTEKEEEIKRYCPLTSHEASITEGVLFFTATLERALGNIYLSKKQPVPYLLRDLFQCDAVTSLLGTIPTIFLKFMIGTPSGLNLRNIAWHGFPLPNELYPHYVSTLFLAIASIGQLLNESHIILDTIPKREQVCFSPKLFDNCFPLVDGYINDVMQIVYHSKYIATPLQEYWKCALTYYLDGRYGSCLLLLLPQLENLLRCVFCSVNGCPKRMLTAESKALFTTLTEVLAANFRTPDGFQQLNNIQSVLGDNLFEILQDLLVHPAGPRVRDKISHGECDFNKVPQLLANHVISICVAILLKISAKREPFVGFENDIMVSCDKYVPEFHATALLKKHMLSVFLSMDRWETYAKPDFDSSTEYEFQEEVQLFKLKGKVDSAVEKYSKKTDSKSLIDQLLSMKVKTIFRPKPEIEIVTILKQIVDKLKVICVEVEKHLEEKYKAHTEYKMRSRQRTTYQRMLAILPHLEKTLNCVNLIIFVWLHKINEVDLIPHKDYGHILKIFKCIRQFVENIANYVHCANNRWAEAIEMAETFCENMCRRIDTLETFI